MYNMVLGEVSKAPVVGSSFSADKKLKHWLKSNDFSVISDHVGMPWQLHVDIRFEAEQPKSFWEASISLKSSLTVEKLLKYKVLDKNSDARLISLLGDRSFPIEMKPKKLQAENIDELKSKYASWLELLNKDFPLLNLEKVKRSILSKWLEKSLTFGGK